MLYRKEIIGRFQYVKCMSKIKNIEPSKFNVNYTLKCFMYTHMTRHKNYKIAEINSIKTQFVSLFLIH